MSGVPALALPDPPLAAPRAGLVLRPWGAYPGDAAALAAAWADRDIQRWCAVPVEREESDAARWVAEAAERRERAGALDLVIADDVEPARVLGEVGLVVADVARGFAEVGFWLLAEQRGRSLAARSVDLVSTWALAALPVRRLFARVSVQNQASARVVAAAGYSLVGHATEGELAVWVREVGGTVGP